MITCSGEIYLNKIFFFFLLEKDNPTGIPRICESFAAFAERNSLPAFVTKTVGIRNCPDVVTSLRNASRV